MALAADGVGVDMPPSRTGRETVTVLRNLADCYARSEQPDEAIAMARRSFSIADRREDLQADPLASLTTIGDIEHRLNRVDDAVDTLSNVLARRVETYGARTPTNRSRMRSRVSPRPCSFVEGIVLMARYLCLVLAALALVSIAACQPPQESATPTTPEPTPVLVLNVTADPIEDPHSVTMALQLAGHGLDDGREVVLFFNVKAVRIPTKGFPEDLAFHADPVKSLLSDLIARGAEAHVCPHCMQALDVSRDSLIDGARVTSREALFAKLRPETNVFTY